MWHHYNEGIFVKVGMSKVYITFKCCVLLSLFTQGKSFRVEYYIIHFENTFDEILLKSTKFKCKQPQYYANIDVLSRIWNKQLLKDKTIPSR